MPIATIIIMIMVMSMITMILSRSLSGECAAPCFSSCFGSNFATRGGHSGYLPIGLGNPKWKLCCHPGLAQGALPVLRYHAAVPARQATKRSFGLAHLDWLLAHFWRLRTLSEFEWRDSVVQWHGGTPQKQEKRGMMRGREQGEWQGRGGGQISWRGGP